MARLRRRRRALKSAGLGLSLLFAVMWCASIPWAWVVGRTSGTNTTLYTFHCYIGGGSLGADSDFVASPIPFSWRVASEDLRLRRSPRMDMRWRPYWVRISNSVRSTRRAWRIILPLWIPFLLCAAPTALILWRDRRRSLPGHCGKCGYDLTGNVSGVCPECGDRI